MKKLYWAIFVIISVGATGGLLYAINKPTPAVAPVVVKPVIKKVETSSTTSTFTGITGWKSYTDSTDSFTVGIPEVDGIFSTVVNNSSLAFAFPNPSGAEPIPTIFVNVIKLSGATNLKTWFLAQNTSNQELLDDSTYVLTSNADGSSLLQLEGSTPDDYSGGPLNNAYILSPDEKTLLIIQYNGQEDPLPALGVDPGDIDSMFNYFLSTFQFTQPQIPTTSAASWQTYTNSQYGYSFKYPQDWTVSPSKDGSFLYVQNATSSVDDTINVEANDEVDNSDYGTSTEQFLSAVTNNLEADCGADAPGDEVALTSVSQQKQLSNLNGLTYYQFYLKEEEFNGSGNYLGIAGPFYVFNITSQTNLASALYIYAFSACNATSSPAQPPATEENLVQSLNF